MLNFALRPRSRTTYISFAKLTSFNPNLRARAFWPSSRAKIRLRARSSWMSVMPRSRHLRRRRTSSWRVRPREQLKHRMRLAGLMFRKRASQFWETPRSEGLVRALVSMVWLPRACVWAEGADADLRVPLEETRVLELLAPVSASSDFC